MIKYINLLILIILSTHLYSQTLQQQIDILNAKFTAHLKLDSVNTAKIYYNMGIGQRADSVKFAILNYEMVTGQKADSIKFAALNYLVSTLSTKLDATTATGRTTAALVLGLRTDSIKKTYQIRNLQVSDSLQLIRIRSLEIDSMYQAKQIAELQKINSLDAIGSLKIKKTGTLAFTITQDSATRLREGNMTPYMWNYIKSLPTKPSTISTNPSTIPIHSNPIPNETIRTTKVLPKHK